MTDCCDDYARAEGREAGQGQLSSFVLTDVITSDNVNLDGKRTKAMAQGTGLHLRGKKAAHTDLSGKQAFAVAAPSGQGNQDGHVECDSQGSRIENEMRGRNDSLSSTV